MLRTVRPVSSAGVKKWKPWLRFLEGAGSAPAVEEAGKEITGIRKVVEEV